MISSRSLTTLGAFVLLAITSAACATGPTSPSGTTTPQSQASTTTPNGATADGMTMTTWNFHLFCEMPASDPRVSQKLNNATGEHPRISYSVDGGPQFFTNAMSIPVPADAKTVKWSAFIADQGENPVSEYKLENKSTETTPGSTVEMVFNRHCGPGEPVPVAPTCKIVTQSPIYAGDSVTVTGTGEPIPTWKANGGVPSMGPAATSFQTKFDGPGDFVIISENSEGEAKCPLTVLPKKIVLDPVACSVVLTQKWVVPTYDQYTKGGVEWVATITPPDPGRSVTVSVDVDGAHSTTLTGTAGSVMSMPFEQIDNNAHTIVGNVSYRHSNGAQCANQAVLKIAPACILETTALGNGVFKATNAGGSGICYGGGTHIPVKALNALANLKATVLTYGNAGQNKYHTSGNNACAGRECDVPVGDLGPNESGVIQTSSDKTTDALVTSTYEGVAYRWGAFPWIGPFPIPVH